MKRPFLPLAAFVAVLALMACQASPDAGGIVRPAVVDGAASLLQASATTAGSNETQTITFLNSDIFEQDFAQLLKLRPAMVLIEFPRKFSVNEIPAHLEPWLIAVKQSGGTVMMQKVRPTTMASRAIIMDLIEFAYDVIRKLTHEDVYASARFYNAVIKYAEDTGNILSVEFIRRSL